jgi:flagellum-specific ATP synthase
VGAYKQGMDKELDEALAKREKIKSFLFQGTAEKHDFNQIFSQFMEVIK